TITFGVKSGIPLIDMSAHMQKAKQLGEQQEINYMDILSSIYASNPC
ncbi:MAG: hypothetical protein GY784_08305, partial [Gammaproteobacteria bacterium]|nr:hypothetical protein [Gammaproteobacteria bacterium]